jgi:hypothetical protein
MDYECGAYWNWSVCGIWTVMKDTDLLTWGEMLSPLTGKKTKPSIQQAIGKQKKAKG